MHLASGLTHGNILLSTSSPPEQSAPLAATSTQNTGEGGLPLDRLEAQLNTLRQQALTTQRSIQQIQGPDEGSHWVMGGEGLVVGLVAVLLGWLTVRLLLGRAQPVVVPETPVVADFAESQYYLTGAAPLPDPVVNTAPQAELLTAMQPSVALAPVFAESQFAHSAPMADSESVLNLFWDSDTPSATPVIEPITEPVIDATAEDVNKVELLSFAPQRAYMEFDPQVAASEVERVRRSLAEKREERNRQRLQDAARRHDRALMDVQHPIEVRIYPEQGLDLDLDLSEHASGYETIAPSLMFVSDGEASDTDGVDDAVDAYLNAHESEPEEPDSFIQLELAQEFAALGLLEGARELAQEVLVSAHAPLQMEAQALLGELDAQEAAQRAGF
jgi:FimV-like protein